LGLIRFRRFLASLRPIVVPRLPEVPAGAPGVNCTGLSPLVTDGLRRATTPSPHGLRSLNLLPPHDPHNRLVHRIRPQRHRKTHRGHVASRAPELLGLVTLGVLPDLHAAIEVHEIRRVGADLDPLDQERELDVVPKIRNLADPLKNAQGVPAGKFEPAVEHLAVLDALAVPHLRPLPLAPDLGQGGVDVLRGAHGACAAMWITSGACGK